MARSRQTYLGFPAWLLLALLALALIKLWLVWDAPLIAMPRSLHDDHLFARLAHSIVEGQWLGRYDQLTLIKGPFYPLFVASTFALRLPLLLAQHLAYVGASFTIVLALWPLLRSPLIALLLFGLLLFDPTTFLAEWCRATRQGVYTTLSLLILAMSAGMAIRARCTPLRLTPWSLGLGLSLGAFWLTREEGAWLLPSVALLQLFCVWVGRRSHHRFSALLLVCVGVPLALPLIAIAGVAAINHSYYGVRRVVELKSPGFLAAFGALERPVREAYDRHHPVPEDVRGRLYSNSSAFAELKGYLEGPRGAMWKDRGVTGSDYRAGPMMWALREAAYVAGHHENAEEAERYYQRLADEVNAACESDRLECAPEWASLAPRPDSRLLAPVSRSTYRAARFLIEYEQSDRQGKPASRGTPEELAFFSEIARGHVQTLGRRSRRDSALGYDAKIPVFVTIAHAYRNVEKWLLLVALIGYVMESASILRTGRIRSVWIILCSVAAAVAIRLTILGIIEETSFTAIRTKYIAPAYALLLVFTVLGIRCVWGRGDAESAALEGIPVRSKCASSAPRERFC